MMCSSHVKITNFVILLLSLLLLPNINEKALLKEEVCVAELGVPVFITYDG